MEATDTSTVHTTRCAQDRLSCGEPPWPSSHPSSSWGPTSETELPWCDVYWLRYAQDLIAYMGGIEHREDHGGRCVHGLGWRRSVCSPTAQGYGAARAGPCYQAVRTGCVAHLPRWSLLAKPRVGIEKEQGDGSDVLGI